MKKLQKVQDNIAQMNKGGASYIRNNWNSKNLHQKNDNIFESTMSEDSMSLISGRSKYRRMKTKEMIILKSKFTDHTFVQNEDELTLINHYTNAQKIVRAGDNLKAVPQSTKAGKSMKQLIAESLQVTE